MISKKILRFFIVLLTVIALCGAQDSKAFNWQEVDSPAFITHQNPATIGAVVKVGDALQYVSPALMYGLIALHWDYEGLWQGTTTMAGTLGSMFILKSATMRQRPNGATDFQSFPSGHTAATMGPAAFVTVRYGFLESIPFWGLGIFTAYSRVAGQRHFITDTLGATALSLLFAYLFVTPLKDEEKLQRRPDIFFLPVTYEGGGLGVNLAFKF